MDDIVERLRQRANILAEAEDDALYVEAKQLREAVDEIERLRKVNTKLQRDLSDRISDIFEHDAEIEQLREELSVNRTALDMKHAEIERLRAANAKAVEALKQISETGTQLGTRYRMASIARATLKEIGGDNG